MLEERETPLTLQVGRRVLLALFSLIGYSYHVTRIEGTNMFVTATAGAVGRGGGAAGGGGRGG
eukprot:3145335-Pyramimonas_sp.AAC.1